MTEIVGVVPNEVTLARDRAEMRLVLWDGQEATISAPSLRAACRCAWCTRDRILGQFVQPDTVAFNDVAALGSHGLHVKFSDGHERGIYPWAYLDELARFAAPAQFEPASIDAPPSIETH